MAVDIKKMVEKISKLTVLELVRLIEAIKEKFGLRTPKPQEKPKPVPNPDNAEVPNPPKVEPVPDDSDEPEKKPTKPKKEPKPVPNPDNAEVPNPPKVEPVPDDSDEPEKKPTKPKKEPKPVPNPDNAEVKPGFNPNLTNYDSNWVPPEQKPNNPSYSSPPKPKGEDYDLVYAWRYSDNKRYAKIGRSTKHLLHTRMPVTYYPTGVPILIGIRKCKNLQHAEDLQNHILKGLKRTLPDLRGHEWVEIDEMFKKMIDKSFISDPDELKKIFGENIKTE